MRLIDADALLNGFIKEWHPKNPFVKVGAIAKIFLAPKVDAVPVIRCKDCVSFTFSSLSCPRTDILVYGVCTEKRLRAPCLTDFCPYGKRKESEAK